jgi:hypothetical protein
MLGTAAGAAANAIQRLLPGYISLEFKKDIVKVNDEGIALTAEAEVEQLLRRPLTPDSAVQIALPAL